MLDLGGAVSLTPEQLEEALCRGFEPLFDYPNKAAGDIKAEDVAKAREFCSDCPIKKECLKDGKSLKDWSVRGGELLRNGKVVVFAYVHRWTEPDLFEPPNNACGSKLHEMTPENTGIKPGTGRRYCKKCHNRGRPLTKRGAAIKEGLCAKGLHKIEGWNEAIDPTTGNRLCRRCSNERRARWAREDYRRKKSGAPKKPVEGHRNSP